MAYNPLVFTEYSKITDTIMWFDKTRVLKFCVSLQSTDKQGNPKPFHSEFKYTTTDGIDKISINRNYSYYFIIDDTTVKGINNNHSVILRSGDVYYLLMYCLDEILKSWNLGNQNMYSKNKNGELILKTTNIVKHFAIDEAHFLEFRPVIIEYSNTNERQAGVRMIINDNNNFVDVPIGKIAEFYQALSMNMHIAAMTMLNYVKSKPYGVNLNSNMEFSSGRGYF